MTAKFLTPDEVKVLSARAFSAAERHVETAYKTVGVGFGKALFNTCMRSWGSGPTSTAARLNSEATEHIIHAWKLRDHIVGLLLQRTEHGLIPLYLHNTSLAHKLSSEGSMWIDFTEVEKEWRNDT